ncbi:MAG: hypothetical protein ACOWW1_01085 [archaeon]|nr:hypothetical protein [Candidatus Bathyarchaeum sp.]
MTNIVNVIPFDYNKLLKIMGYSPQAGYIIRYLSDPELDAKTVVIEEKYIDRDYLLDYQSFYSRSFNDVPRITKRLHFFSEIFSSRKFNRILKNKKKDYFSKTKSYLGFLVLKPVQNEKGETIIGRTLLKPYPKTKGQIIRHYIEGNYTISLCGIELSINAAPFQVQDRGVSACATISLWIALRLIKFLFDFPNQHPSKITELSNELVSEARVFPQDGLNLDQMLKCIKLLGLDVEVIRALDSDTVTSAVKAYTNAGIPLIAALKLTKKPEVIEEEKTKDDHEHHAAVIVGYQTDGNGKLTKLYVHDDQVGPYSKVEAKSNDDFREWKNEWVMEPTDYSKLELEKIIVPICPKIRLPWLTIYDGYEEICGNLDQNEKVDLYLYTVQKYKNELLQRDIKEKTKQLKRFLPRFIWVERFSDKITGSPRMDYLFDGTEVYSVVNQNLTPVIYE